MPSSLQSQGTSCLCETDLTHCTVPSLTYTDRPFHVQTNVLSSSHTSVQSHQLHDTVFVFLSRFVYQAASQSWSADQPQRHCMPAQRTAPLMPAAVCTTVKSGSTDSRSHRPLKQMIQGTRRVQTSDSATTVTTVHLQAIEQSPLGQSQVVPCRTTEVQAS